MNDLNKEELIILFLYLPGDSYPELKDKLQSMINNYDQIQKQLEYLDLLKNSGGIRS